jgi:hypothetical protein
VDIYIFLIYVLRFSSTSALLSGFVRFLQDLCSVVLVRMFDICVTHVFVCVCEHVSSMFNSLLVLSVLCVLLYALNCF